MRPLARNSDPSTSHAAGRAARAWSMTHRDQILGVLWRPMIASEIAKFTGLTVVQIDRRMPELEQASEARLTGFERDGMREWEKVL